MVVATLDPKFYGLDKDLSIASEDKILGSLFVLSNVTQFLLQVLLVERQMSDYLINCTDIITYMLKWLKRVSGLYQVSTFKNNIQNLRVADEAIQNIHRLLHTCLYVNKDLCVFYINKRYSEKRAKVGF